MRNASLLLVLVSTFLMLQAVLITPILAIIRDSNHEQWSSTFLLRIIVACAGAYNCHLVAIDRPASRSFRAPSDIDLRSCPLCGLRPDHF